MFIPINYFMCKISSLSCSKVPQCYIEANVTDEKVTYGEKNYMSQFSAMESS